MYSCLVNSFGCICFQPEDKGKLSLSHKQGNPLEGHILIHVITGPIMFSGLVYINIFNTRVITRDEGKSLTLFSEFLRI